MACCCKLRFHSENKESLTLELAAVKWQGGMFPVVCWLAQERCSGPQAPAVSRVSAMGVPAAARSSPAPLPPGCHSNRPGRSRPASPRRTGPLSPPPGRPSAPDWSFGNRCGALGSSRPIPRRGRRAGSVSPDSSGAPGTPTHRARLLQCLPLGAPGPGAASRSLRGGRAPEVSVGSRGGSQPRHPPTFPGPRLQTWMAGKGTCPFLEPCEAEGRTGQIPTGFGDGPGKGSRTGGERLFGVSAEPGRGAHRRVGADALWLRVCALCPRVSSVCARPHVSREREASPWTTASLGDLLRGRPPRAGEP